MNSKITAILTAAILLPLAQAWGEEVPSWVKSSAGWWAEGAISDEEFVLGIQYLIGEGIMTIPDTPVSSYSSDGIPEWVKTTAGWWADGSISDGEFVSAIQHLMSTGVMAVPVGQASPAEDGPDACSSIKRTIDRLDCERDAKKAAEALDYRENGRAFEAGPITYYFKGNSFEINTSGQPLLDVSILAVNNGEQTVTLACTGPSICNYDVWDGTRAYKYASTDFTNGAIVLDPGSFRVFTMLFGPNIGYGGTTLEYHPDREYVLRISEPWGSTTLPLVLQ
ncbi:secreted periplasmic Zn-dependent protease [Cenarchaeum symbiosum A]|uniref:Secreted periplasmic Zn-dependent protease n=1 Tax=Cenarchaeum symbiosum (strain A) TaxID=414004 RepID=A0RWH3_CENSY|nr:secreted periplasmic Zn-dependent protease [Cenarchaeum symbiosum A]